MAGEPQPTSAANGPIMGKQVARPAADAERDATTARVVIVLAKAPVAGRAKTRLTPPATPAGAAGVAAAALLDTLDAASGVPDAAVLVALEGDVSAAERAGELADALRGTVVVAQRGESLGERIAAAHDDAARLFPGAASLQIGMDTPQVDAALLTAAFAGVEAGADAGLGLAADGGWWALALRDPGLARVVSAVPTSRDDTGRATLAALRAGRPGLGPIRVLELPTLSDVDTADDAVAVSDLAPHGRFARAVGDLLPVPGGLAR